MINEPKALENFFLYSNSRIHYKLIGQGHCVVLLHGYLESLDVWNGFANELSKSHQVLLIDLPGHGKSEILSECDTIEEFATSINAILDYLKISRAFMVGHSMGGYVALAFADLFPTKTNGLCLFHSTPNADSSEKRISRMQEVEQIKNGERRLIIEKNIPLRFADKNITTFQHELEQSKKIALAIQESGIIGTLMAMASRLDRNHIIENAIFPILMIFGALDNHIPLSVANDLAIKHKKTRTVILDNSGHMGFIEERDQALKAIKFFLADVFS